MKNLFKFIIKCLFIIIVFTLLTQIFDMFGTVLLCDSGSINEFVEDFVSNTSNIDEVKPKDNIIPDPIKNSSLLKYIYKIKCKISWWINGKYTDRYNSYREFKDSWNPQTKLRKEIKDAIKQDFNETRINIDKTNKNNMHNNLMSDVKNSQLKSSINRNERIAEMLNIRKK